MKNSLLIALTLFCLTGCKKTNVREHMDYVEFWRNVTDDVTRTIEVNSTGQCFYKERTELGSSYKIETHDGIFFLEGTVLKVGTKKFTVNKEPSMIQDDELLTLNNIIYKGN